MLQDQRRAPGPVGEDVIDLTLGHSPDADDAFMWWAITAGAGESGVRRSAGENSRTFRFHAVLDDIQTLNDRAEAAGDLDITAISCAQYPAVASKYAITSCGASFGRGYGPKLVCRRPRSLESLSTSDQAIAVPGDRTTAALLAGLAAGGPPTRFVAVPFDQVIERVASGEFESGVVIHEGQLTFAEAGLHLIADLGAWWTERTGLPLPLGLNVIRRDLDKRYGAGTLEEVTAILSESIRSALVNRKEAVEYARQFGRGISDDVADAFVDLYVNDLTLDCGEEGERAIRVLLQKAAVATGDSTTGPVTIIRPKDPPPQTQ